MARYIIPEEVWQRVQAHFPQRPPRLKGGRPVVADRDVLTGILFVLKTGIAWDDLPAEMGCGCGVTCLRRLRDWHQAGTWKHVSQTLQQSMPKADRIDWFRAEVDGRSNVRRRRRPRAVAGYGFGGEVGGEAEASDVLEAMVTEESPLSEA